MDGDRVEAVVDERDRRSVTGILRLRHVPSLNYVQVLVENKRRLSFVDPASIVVITPDADPVADEDLHDPIMGDVGWRRIVDLDAAIAEGLVASVDERPGGTWEEMAAAVRSLAGPLVGVGWTVVEEDRDESDEHGDSVSCIVERDGKRVDLELYDYGTLAVYDEELPDDDEDNKFVLSIDDATVEECRREFAMKGWLDPV